ncbi:MAG: helix-turn-helix transcriptional regulator, partial [Gemmatimonadaceae bacterium]
LYQAVYRLEARGLLEADWGVTENNRRARYYKLSAAGRAFLRTETKNWMQYAETVTTILTASKDAGRVTAS